MPKREDLNTRRNLSLRGHGLINKECAYNIVHSNKKYDVILFKSNNKDYKGTGLQLYFENFATHLKNHRLENINHRDIRWYQWDEWKSDCYEDRLLPVSMDFDGNRYINAVWGTEVKFEE